VVPHKAEGNEKKKSLKGRGRYGEFVVETVRGMGIVGSANRAGQGGPPKLKMSENHRQKDAF